MTDNAMKKSTAAPVVLGWIIVAASAAGNGWLVYQSIRFAFGSDASAAQADFELFWLVSTIGGPIAVISFFVLVAFALSNIRDSTYWASLAKNPAVLICVTNIFIPACLFAYVLSIR